MSEVIVVIGPGLIGQAIARRVGVGKHIVLADLHEASANAAAETLGCGEAQSRLNRHPSQIGPTGPTRLALERSNERTPTFAGVLRVELGGLEPPTSWVRSRRSPN